MANSIEENYDVILAGGGLASTLLAVRLRERHPTLKLLLVEQAETLGANHTWSFHTTDLKQEHYDWIKPFIACAWPDQQLKFPKFTRIIDVGYNTISAEKFHAVAMERIGESVRLATRVTTLGRDHVILNDGQRYDAQCVIDARGLKTDLPLALGFQKFLGLEIRCIEPHGETRPTIMDATVSQKDGYRFVYTLPFDTHRLLVEDTYYSDGEDVSVDQLRERVKSYIAAQGWQIADVEREENGVLPVVLGGDMDALWRNRTETPPPLGLRAALFHPTTGYSLPDAVRAAESISNLDGFTTTSVAIEIERLSRAAWSERRYFRLLNRMLFRGALPHERVDIFQHFYRLGTGTISRFYAARLNGFDKARILIGKPPIPVSKALPCLLESSVWPPSEPVG